MSLSVAGLYLEPVPYAYCVRPQVDPGPSLSASASNVSYDIVFSGPNLYV